MYSVYLIRDVCRGVLKCHHGMQIARQDPETCEPYKDYPNNGDHGQTLGLQCVFEKGALFTNKHMDRVHGSIILC